LDCPGEEEGEGEEEEGGCKYTGKCSESSAEWGCYAGVTVGGTPIERVVDSWGLEVTWETEEECGKECCSEALGCDPPCPKIIDTCANPECETHSSWEFETLPSDITHGPSWTVNETRLAAWNPGAGRAMIKYNSKDSESCGGQGNKIQKGRATKTFQAQEDFGLLVRMFTNHESRKDFDIANLKLYEVPTWCKVCASENPCVRHETYHGADIYGCDPNRGPWGTEEGEEGDAPSVGKFGDLYRECSKKLIGEMDSRDMGPIREVQGTASVWYDRAEELEVTNHNCNLEALGDCESDTCGLEKTLQVEKGKVYVIEINIDSVDTADHKDHWWEIHFNKGGKAIVAGRTCACVWVSEWYVGGGNFIGGYWKCGSQTWDGYSEGLAECKANCYDQEECDEGEEITIPGNVWGGGRDDLNVADQRERAKRTHGWVSRCSILNCIEKEGACCVGGIGYRGAETSWEHSPIAKDGVPCNWSCYQTTWAKCHAMSEGKEIKYGTGRVATSEGSPINWHGEGTECTEQENYSNLLTRYEYEAEGGEGPQGGGFGGGGGMGTAQSVYVGGTPYNLGGGWKDAEGNKFHCAVHAASEHGPDHSPTWPWSLGPYPTYSQAFGFTDPYAEGWTPEHQRGHHEGATQWGNTYAAEHDGHDTHLRLIDCLRGDEVMARSPKDGSYKPGVISLKAQEDTDAGLSVYEQRAMWWIRWDDGSGFSLVLGTEIYKNDYPCRCGGSGLSEAFHPGETGACCEEFTDAMGGGGYCYQTTEDQCHWGSPVWRGTSHAGLYHTVGNMQGYLSHSIGGTHPPAEQWEKGTFIWRGLGTVCGPGNATDFRNRDDGNNEWPYYTGPGWLAEWGGGCGPGGCLGMWGAFNALPKLTNPNSNRYTMMGFNFSLDIDEDFEIAKRIMQPGWAENEDGSPSPAFPLGRSCCGQPGWDPFSGEPNDPIPGCEASWSATLYGRGSCRESWYGPGNANSFQWWTDHAGVAHLIGEVPRWPMPVFNYEVWW
jgi:hypothetical protein